MKTKLFTLFLALAASVGTMSAASWISVTDNSIADWNDLPQQYVFEAVRPSNATFPGLKSVKVYADPIYINILVEPDMSVVIDREWVPFHVFIDADNLNTTGGYGDLFTDANTDLFTDANTDLLLETSLWLSGTPYNYNPAVFKWWGEVGGSGWDWVDPNVDHNNSDYWGAIIGEGQLPVGNSQYVDGKFEIQLLRELLGTVHEMNDSEFGIGFDIQQNWSSVGVLPQVSSTSGNPYGKAAKMKITIDDATCRIATVEGINYLINESSNIAAVMHSDYMGDIVIPASIEYENKTYIVTDLQMAFYNCSNVTSITIKSTNPPYISDNCFYNCPAKIYVPCGTLETYRNADGWRIYANRINYPALSITTIAENGTVSVPQNITICDGNVLCTAIPYRGYQFIRWADGNTENPRTIELTQDTTMEAIFDYLLTGKCGKDSVLTWTLDTTTMALEITGKGALSENYTYGTFIESLTIGNEITQIGAAAFYRFEKLKNVILGSSVKVLESEAFRKCYAIETITCYSQRPPTVNEGALYGLDYSTIVYVPADYLNTYIMHDAWGLYDVRPLGAISTETTEVKVTPSETTAEVVWPTISGAATYELVIKDKDGNVICTLIFNANGQLTQIAFNAPSRDHALQQTQAAGFSFTVTGLEGGTSYDLTMTSKDSNGSTLDEKTISFTTSGEQGFEDVNASTTIHKLLHNGQILILRGDKTYTLTGQEIIVP